MSDPKPQLPTKERPMLSLHYDEDNGYHWECSCGRVGTEHFDLPQAAAEVAKRHYRAEHQEWIENE